MNKNFGKRSRDVSGIIIHAMGQYIKYKGEDYFAKDWLDFLGLSVHYYIDVDGTIIKGVDPDYRAYHAGKSEWKGETDLNQSFIGIELLVEGAYNYSLLKQKINDVENKPYTSKQYQSCAKQCVYLLREYPKITEDRILQHSQVSGADVRPDPKFDAGKAFDMNRLKMI